VTFVDEGSLRSAGSDPVALHALLTAADWTALTSIRDLREVLYSVERAHGVTEAHHLATRRILERGARLYTTHPGSGDVYAAFAR
jgi:hypothetical protein